MTGEKAACSEDEVVQRGRLGSEVKAEEAACRECGVRWGEA